MTIPDLISQVRQLNPQLADQLTEELTPLARWALQDIEGLLTEHLDLNIFNCSGHLIPSIEPLVRLVAQLNSQSVESVMLEVRHGDEWRKEQADCVPDWGDSTEFPSAIED